METLRLLEGVFYRENAVNIPGCRGTESIPLTMSDLGNPKRSSTTFFFNMSPINMQWLIYIYILTF